MPGVPDGSKFASKLLHFAHLFPFFDAAPDAIIVVDEDGVILLANHQTEEVFGYPREELLGEKVEVLVPEDLRAAHVGHREGYVEDAKRRPMGLNLELSGQRKDGSEFPVEISLSPLQAGESTLTVAAIRDRTERKQAEQRFQDLLEAAPDAIILADRGGSIQLVNREAERMFGWERDDLLGEPVEVLIPQRFHDDHVGHREGYMEDPSSRPMGMGLELYGVRQDGSEFPVEISLSPLATEDGDLVMAAVRDMTEREEARRELQRYAKRLERSNQDWEQFAHVVSHDLQEPIRMVRSYAQLLEDRYGDAFDEDGEEFLGYLTEGAERMHRVIQGLLQYSRVDTRASAPEVVDPREALTDALSDLAITLDETDANVEVEEMPPVVVDRSQLTQVFQNLVSNAVKFRRDDVPPEVRVGGDLEGEVVHVRVADNGIGIEEHQRERIFTIFQRLHGRGAYQGEGVGLSVCKKIVERHDGRIWVESAVGKGSTFHFTLPSAEAGEARSPVHEAHDGGDEPQRQGHDHHHGP